MNGKPPETIRFIWFPLSGEMKIGDVSAHAAQINASSFDSWVRGFYFPSRKLFAIRTFFMPKDAYDNWDDNHAELDNYIQGTLTSILSSMVPGAKVQKSISNEWLKSNISQSQRW